MSAYSATRTMDWIPASIRRMAARLCSSESMITVRRSEDIDRAVT